MGDVPSYSWRCAEIISGNGDTYFVKYDRYMGGVGDVDEKVPIKAVRPCPPPMATSRSWVPVDVVEVFGDSSWKIAEVRSVDCGGYYFVRLLGSSTEFRAHSSVLRLRQSWQEKEWVVIGKDWDKYGDNMRNREPREGMLNRRTIQVGKQLQDKHSRTANKTDLKELPSICMKKQKLYLPPLEICTGVERTLAPVEERGMRHLKVAAHTRKLHPKIHAAGEKCMHLKKRTGKSTSSSIASCSTSNKPYRPSHTINSSTDDAESFFVSGSFPLLPTEEAMKAEIRRLELSAYPSTLSAFHAYDSISWEQEALLTNLRLALHISTDDHLLELKKLALGDCKELIDWIHEEAPNPTPYEEFKVKVTNLLPNTSSTLTFIPRICNQAADMLAKMGRDGITDSWKEVPPPNLQHLLLLEAKSEKATFGDPRAASDKLTNVL